MNLLLVFLLHLSFINSSDSAQEILDQWITAHNSGSWDQMESFARSNYSPELLSSINLDEHLAFYDAMYVDFGEVEPFVYELISESSSELEVYLLKKGANSFDPPTTEILVVRIQLSDKYPSKVGAKLGLVQLSCQQKGTDLQN